MSIAIAFATIAIALIPAAPAAALTTEHAGGGLFQYGVESGSVISNYHHATKYHTATACHGGLINKCKQVAAAPNLWAKAKHPATWSGGNKAYWSTY